MTGHLEGKIIVPNNTIIKEIAQKGFLIDT